MPVTGLLAVFFAKGRVFGFSFNFMVCFRMFFFDVDDLLTLNLCCNLGCFLICWVLVTLVLVGLLLCLLWLGCKGLTFPLSF